MNQFIKFIFFNILFVTFAICVVFGQEVPLGTPEQYGKCYGKAQMPPTYEEVDQEYLIKPEALKIINIPAVYDTIAEEVLIKEETIEYITIPAVYETVTEKVLVKEGGTAVREKYESYTDSLLIQEKRGEWVMRRDPNCFSPNPADCEIRMWREVPAQYQKNVRKTLTEISDQEYSTTLPEYKYITKQVLKSAAEIKQVITPAQYATIKKAILKEPAKTEEIKIPAQYGIKKVKRIVNAGGYSDWQEIICPEKLTRTYIKQIQTALRAQGFNISVDGVIGAETQKTILLFQTQKDLPKGNLNKLTLNQLNLTY